MSACKKTVRIALVVDDNESYDGSSVQVIDVKKLEMLSQDRNIFLIETESFNSSCFSEGAIYSNGSGCGFSLSFDEIASLLSSISKK